MSADLDGVFLDRARDALASAGLTVGAAVWIDEGIAADVTFEGDLGVAKAALSPLTATVDVIVQSGEHRRKSMLISDMDSTMIQIECIDELADYAGIKAQIAEVTERAMRGELDFIEALRGRVALLKDLDEAAIAACLSERVVLMPGARTLVQTMCAWGAETVLVSGGFTHFTTPVMEQIGFHQAHSNVLGLADGRLTGEVLGDVVDASAKARLLHAISSAKGLTPAHVLAVGDGANDIPMIEAAGLGIAYHAKEKARAAADASVSVGDLTALLYAQGVPRSEWVA